MAGLDQKVMMRTRAELLDVKPKVLAARVKRRLKTLRSQLTGIAAAFEDIDMSVVSAAESLEGAFEEFEQIVDESVRYLQEVPDW